jgi:hypothetical protein
VILRAFAMCLLVSCGGESPPAAEPPVQAPTAGLPVVEWAVPTRVAHTPVATRATPELEASRRLLGEVVAAHATDPQNPWAVSHGLLALGPELVLGNGEPAVRFLFAEYAKEQAVGGDRGVAFERRRGAIRIEPHTDLLLKAMTEAGVAPTDEVTVQGAPHVIGDLYRTSLHRTWVDGDKVSAGTWNDMPWTLRGLAAWAPAGLSWEASGGRDMTLDAVTLAAAQQLAAECAFIREAMARNETFQKRGQGIFDYTCGGAHLYQAVAYAVARGFGGPQAREAVVEQIPGLFARLEVELAQVDAALRSHPDYTVVLVTQRLKFLGHFLETTHKMAALELFEPSEEQAAAMQRAADELVATVAVINQLRLFERLDEVRKADEQVYLDLVGDSAHAVRGIDIATGAAGVRY